MPGMALECADQNGNVWDGAAHSAAFTPHCLAHKRSQTNFPLRRGTFSYSLCEFSTASSSTSTTAFPLCASLDRRAQAHPPRHFHLYKHGPSFYRPGGV